MTKPNEFAIGYKFTEGNYDRVRIEPSGIVTIEGWLLNIDPKKKIPQCSINGKPITYNYFFNTYRPDVALSVGASNFFSGVVYSYSIKDNINDEVTLEITEGEESIFSQKIFITVAKPAYAELFNTSTIKKRSDIYNEGMPVDTVATVIQDLVKDLPGPLLDFGCGIGNLVKDFRDKGIEAYGIEIDRPEISNNIIAEVKDYITLFNGKGKLPFKDNQFKSVIAIEVMEHIENYSFIISELSRITSQQFIMTTPDISSIPLNHNNMVVPWHLLEATHVNFYTQRSLEQLLQPYFSVQMGKICPVLTNQSLWYVSLIARCTKKSSKD